MSNPRRPDDTPSSATPHRRAYELDAPTAPATPLAGPRPVALVTGAARRIGRRNFC